MYIHLFTDIYKKIYEIEFLLRELTEKGYRDPTLIFRVCNKAIIYKLCSLDPFPSCAGPDAPLDYFIIKEKSTRVSVTLKNNCCSQFSIFPDSDRRRKHTLKKEFDIYSCSVCFCHLFVSFIFYIRQRLTAIQFFKSRMTFLFCKPRIFC